MWQKRKSLENQNVILKSASINDIEVLAVMNQDLIRDEGSGNPMNLEQLKERMNSYLNTEYKAVLFQLSGEIAGYCLYRLDQRIDCRKYDVYVRHFYVKPSFRRNGIGKRAFRQLRENTFKSAVELKLDVLESNSIGMAFWANLGFEPYSYNLRIRV